MNDNNLEKIIKSAQGVSLSNEEKLSIKNSVLDYVSKNPIQKPFIKSPFYMFDLLSFRPLYSIPIAVILFAFIGGGSTYMSQNSLPGETLYPLKVNVSENIESLVALTDEAKIDVDLNQINQRLSEAETLNNLGELSEVKTKTIQTNLSKKVESINKKIEKARNKGKNEIAQKASERLQKEIDDRFDVFVAVSNSASNSPVFASLYESKRERDGVIFATLAMDTGATSRKSSKVNEKEVEFEIDDDENEDEDEDDNKNNISLMSIATVEPSIAQSTTTIKYFTLSEVSKHNKSTDCYSVVSGKVYDLTKWITKHPGGESAIKLMCGKDATKEFNAQHKGQGKPEDQLVQYKIGVIK